MLRRLCGQATQTFAYGNRRAYESSAAVVGSLDDGTHHNNTHNEHTMPHQKPDRELSPMPHQKQGGLWGTSSISGLAQFTSLSSDMHVLTAMRDHTHRSSLLAGAVPSTGMKRSTQVLGQYVFPAALFAKSLMNIYPTHGFYESNKTAFSSGVCVNVLRVYSSSAEVHEPTCEDKADADQKVMEDVPKISLSSTEVEEQTNKGKEGTNQEDAFTQMLEMIGMLVDGDVSAAANELRQAQQEMLVHMRRCSRVLLAVAAVHLTWGVMMFSALESPLNHAVVTEICMSSLVIGALAYQVKQTTKPIKLLTDREEHRKVKIVYLSRQVSRMLGAFFQRGYGIAFVLSLALTAHAMSCMGFLL